MEKYTVTLSGLTQRIEEEQKMAGTLTKLAANILVVSTSLSFQVQRRENLKNTLRRLVDEVDYYSSGMREMHAALSNVRSEYEKTERQICRQSHESTVGEVRAEFLGVHAEIDGESEGSEKADWSLLWKAVGGAGPVGKAISTIGQVVTGNNGSTTAWEIDCGLFSISSSTATWMKGASDAWSTGWKIADTVKKCKKDPSISWLEAALGLNKNSFLKGMSQSNLSLAERVMHGKDKVLKGLQRELKTTKGRIKQVGSTVFSFAVNAVSNYEEYVTGAISLQRAAAETVMETAVDWGKNLLIDVAVTAGFAAAGIAAPVLVVGAATVVVSAAVDWVSEKLCGKKLTEAVSDCVLDGAEAVADWTVSTIKTGADKIKKGASAVWSGISKGWKSLTGGRLLSFA